MAQAYKSDATFEQLVYTAVSTREIFPLCTEL